MCSTIFHLGIVSETDSICEIVPCNGPIKVEGSWHQVLHYGCNWLGEWIGEVEDLHLQCAHVEWCKRWSQYRSGGQLDIRATAWCALPAGFQDLHSFSSFLHNWLSILYPMAHMCTIADWHYVILGSNRIRRVNKDQIRVLLSKPAQAQWSGNPDKNGQQFPDGWRRLPPQRILAL